MKTMYRLLLAGAMMLPGVDHATAQETNVRIMIKDNKTVGAYLADQDGRTMYWKKRTHRAKAAAPVPACRPGRPSASPRA